MQTPRERMFDDDEEFRAEHPEGEDCPKCGEWIPEGWLHGCD